MKKITAIVMCAVMVFAMAFTAMAGTKGSHLGGDSSKQEKTQPDEKQESADTETDVNTETDYAQILEGLLDEFSALENGESSGSEDYSQILQDILSGISTSEDGESSGSLDISGILDNLFTGSSIETDEVSSSQLQDLLSDIGTQLSDAFSDAEGSAEENLNDLSGTIQNSLSSILDSVAEAAGEIKNSLGDLLGAIADAAGNAAEKLQEEQPAEEEQPVEEEQPMEEVGAEVGDTITVLGGWSVNDEFTPAAFTDKETDVFEQAMEGLTGVNYLPAAVLATQVVAGTNYAYLCSGTPVTLNAVPAWYVVTIYENLQGETEILSIKEILLNDIKTCETTHPEFVGGWTVQPAETPAELPEEAQAAFDGAMANMLGVDYQAIVLLGTQIVAGTNYKILCYGTTVTEEPVTSLYVADLYADLEGGVEVTNLQLFDLTSYIEY